MVTCLAVSLGTVEYTRALELQRSLHRQVAEGSLPDLLLFLEHPHVYTLGRRGKDTDVLVSEEKLSRLGAEVHRTDRGGEVTYHGPGQLVGYPVVDLRRWGGGPMKYVRALEDSLVATLRDFGVQAGRDDKPTGVWVGDAKIAAIGVKISRRVTMHGFALNVHPDLSYFEHIVPCGMPRAGVTSMESLLSKELSVEQVIPVLADHFGATFGARMEWAGVESLGAVVGV
ncbi:MAG: lipoyl(octanoyl) transferase LipB [Chloroflexi bacterium]|nr:lipoyl(octanoyl) transferase LipB [Chloroflexota bacterium]